MIVTPTSDQYVMVSSIKSRENAPTTFLTLPLELRHQILIESFTSWSKSNPHPSTTAFSHTSQSIKKVKTSITTWKHVLEQVHWTLDADIAYAAKIAMERLFEETLAVMEGNEKVARMIERGYVELSVRARAIQMALRLNRRPWTGVAVLGGIVGITSVVARMF